jgi:hypothetical protein
MKPEHLIWAVVFVIAGAFLAWRAVNPGIGQAYVEVEPQRFVEVPAPAGVELEDGEAYWLPAEEAAAEGYAVNVDEVEGTRRAAITGADVRDTRQWIRAEPATQREYVLQQQAGGPAAGENPIVFSWSRTIGVWVAALLTLCIFSFLYRDNPFYKLAESIVVGVSAAYWMVVGWWTTVVPNLIGKLFPEMVKGWALPGLYVDGTESAWEQGEWVYVIPLILGIMLLMRLSPKGAWISRWPLAFIIGTTAGFRLTGFIDGDLLKQVSNTVTALYVPEGTAWMTFWSSAFQLITVIAVLSCLVYFFFSIEHRGVVGKTAKLGIWFLMVTFGAAFAYTVMGRIALLAIRVEYLVDEWLWLIDPLNRRIVDGAAMLSHAWPGALPF